MPRSPRIIGHRFRKLLWLPKGRNRLRSVLARVLLFCLLFLGSGAWKGRAHICGPTRIELQVGQTCPWRIIADRKEVLTRYAPALDGDQSVAKVEPLVPSMAHHGDFLITGRNPGTNSFSVAWSYEPTGAFGLCELTIVVRAADPNDKPLDAPSAGGSLAAEGLQMITGEDLKGFIDQYVPSECQRLLIFTQCFGGNIAFSEGFRDMPNTAIASATSPNQKARYGGYDDDVSRAFRPEAGRTALDMHRDGIRGRSTVLPPEDGTPQTKKYLFEESEWPVTAGGLGLESFSLAPVSAEGSVKSRHIIFYAGQPQDQQSYLESQDGYTVNGTEDPKATEVGDPAVRDRVKSNFANQPNTTVRTVGGKPVSEDSTDGMNGWDLAGTYQGLERAIKEAGEAIRNAPDPSAEQFILYVGDHGGEGFTLVADSSFVDSGTTLTIPLDLSTLSGAGTWLDYNEYETGNIPTIQLEAAPTEGGGNSPRGIYMAAAGDSEPWFELVVTPEGGRPVVLPAPEVLVIDVDGDGRIEPADGDRFRQAFPFPESLIVGPGKASAFELRVTNVSGQGLTISNLQLNSGTISKNNSIVTPPFFRSVELVAPGRIHFQVRGAPGETYRLESSDGLGSWTTLRDVYFDSEIIDFEQDFSGSVPNNFFRFVWELPPPLDF